MTVSVMLDPNGSNTTAAAIVRKVMTNYDINDKKVVIIGSGPVGQRTALFFLKEGAGEVVITSRDITRSTAISLQMKSAYGVNITAGEAANDESVNKLLNDAHIAIACGPPGVCVIPQSAWESNDTLEVVADVNAVPPQGIAGLDVMDNGTDKKGIRFYGALTIGNFKMKVHRAAIKSLYESNNQFLNESTIYDIACKITSK